MRYAIQGGTIVTPNFILEESAIVVDTETGRIVHMGRDIPAVEAVVSLEKHDIVFPGLINAHDHLLGTYYPRVGKGPYLNWYPWDNDLKSHPLYEERSRLSNRDLYLLGAYKNLISGAVVVSDHMPHVVNEPLISDLPITVIRDYTLEHECSSYDLRWGRGITVEHTEARERGIPFITHVEEGFDEEATLGVDILMELGALDEYTVLIHGISLSERDVELIARQKAHLVWCPSSNYFMFQTTAPIKRLLEAGVCVALGTDSPMSGGLHILDEMQFADHLYEKLYGEKLDPAVLVRMVTVNAARALRRHGEGEIVENALAHFTVIRKGSSHNPYEALVHADLSDVRMVIRQGVPLYGSRDFLSFFSLFPHHYQQLTMAGEERILIGKPIHFYAEMCQKLGFRKQLPFFPVTLPEGMALCP